MQPFSTPCSLGIHVPSVARCHTPAWLVAFVSHPSPISSKPSSAPPQRLWGGCSHPALPLCQPQGWGDSDFPVIAETLLTLSQQAWGRQGCYKEAKSHFSTLNILSFVPSPPSCPFLSPSKHHGVFFPPGADVSSAFVGGRCRSGPGRAQR